MLPDPYNPAAWEAYRLSMTPHELISELRERPEPIYRARKLEAMALSQSADMWREALAMLDAETLPLSAGTRVQLLTLLGLWEEAVRAALAYDLPDNATPLDWEEASLILMTGGMSARTLGRDELAARMHGGAIVLAKQAGMKHRARMLRVEGARVDNLGGSGDPEQARSLIEPDMPARARAHAIHVYAETQCARGLYEGALGVLAGMDDARSVGMRAFCAAVLGQAVTDPGGDDDWLRLSRAVRALHARAVRVDDLGMRHEPQATYARLLTAWGEVLTGGGDRTLRLLGGAAPGFADQLAAWAFQRSRAGVMVGSGEVTREALGAWLRGIAGMYDARGALRVLAAALPEWFVALSFLPDAPPAVIQVRAQMPLIVGEDLLYQGGMIAGKGRAGVVLIGEAAGAEVKPLESSERKRWEIRIDKLRRVGGLPSDPINLGAVIVSLLELGAVGVDVRHALRGVVDMLSPDARQVILPALRGVTDEETLAFIRGGSVAERGGVGRSLPELPDGC